MPNKITNINDIFSLILIVESSITDKINDVITIQDFRNNILSEDIISLSSYITKKIDDLYKIKTNFNKDYLPLSGGTIENLIISDGLLNTTITNNKIITTSINAASISISDNLNSNYITTNKIKINNSGNEYDFGSILISNNLISMYDGAIDEEQISASISVSLNSNSLDINLIGLSRFKCK